MAGSFNGGVREQLKYAGRIHARACSRPDRRLSHRLYKHRPQVCRLQCSHHPAGARKRTKVVALGCNLIKNSHADLKTSIQQGNTCVVRQAQVAPDDAVMIQLIGVTVVRFGKAWEPCWDARGLKALEEMRGRDVQLL